MRKTVILISVVASISVRASDRTVTVCLAPQEVNFRTQVLAEGYASRIYHSIGINLRWKHSCTNAELNNPGTAFTANSIIIGIEWAANAPLTVPIRALAAARPFQPTGNRITLYLDRLKGLLENGLAAAVLGHVLAHEIGHVLLGHNGHSNEGLMKATWSQAEMTAMPHRLMKFTAYQAEELNATLDHSRVTLALAR
jgi:hypothetical protein